MRNRHNQGCQSQTWRWRMAFPSKFPCLSFWKRCNIKVYSHLNIFWIFGFFFPTSRNLMLYLLWIGILFGIHTSISVDRTSQIVQSKYPLNFRLHFYYIAKPWCSIFYELAFFTEFTLQCPWTEQVRFFNLNLVLSLTYFSNPSHPQSISPILKYMCLSNSLNCCIRDS